MVKGFWNSSGRWVPWVAGIGMSSQRPRFFEPGEVRIAILSLLSEGPKHGYQLMKEMKDRSGGLYEASAGSVYPTLQQLEDEGLIESKRDDGRRVYELTDSGRKELENDPEAVRRIWERAESWEDWGRNTGPEIWSLFGSMGPMGQVIKLSMRAAKWAAGKPEREDKLTAILRRTCSDLEGLVKK